MKVSVTHIIECCTANMLHLSVNDLHLNIHECIMNKCFYQITIYKMEKNHTTGMPKLRYELVYIIYVLLFKYLHLNTHQ